MRVVESTRKRWASGLAGQGPRQSRNAVSVRRGGSPGRCHLDTRPGHQCVTLLDTTRAPTQMGVPRARLPPQRPGHRGRPSWRLRSQGARLRPAQSRLELQRRCGGSGEGALRRLPAGRSWCDGSGRPGVPTSVRTAAGSAEFCRSYLGCGGRAPLRWPSASCSMAETPRRQAGYLLLDYWPGPLVEPVLSDARQRPAPSGDECGRHPLTRQTGQRACVPDEDPCEHARSPLALPRAAVAPHGLREHPPDLSRGVEGVGARDPRRPQAPDVRGK